MRFFIVDLKRALQERNFIFSLVFGILLVMGSFSYYFYGHTSYESGEAFKLAQSYVYPFLAPLLASLPYSNMNMLEKDYGYDLFLFNKARTRSYVLRRGLVNSIVGGLALFIPVSLLFISCRILGPYPDKMVFIRVLFLDYLFGSSVASLSYSLTFVNTKRYIPVVAPQVIYLLLTYAFPYLSLEAYYPPLCFSPWVLGGEVNEQAIHRMIRILLGGVTLILLLIAFLKALQRRRR